jgi:DNA-binding transcriptional LysR family regulator
MRTLTASYFLALCETLNFGEAARRCGISQPTLTKCLRGIEAELGGRLFHRRPRVRLTRLGELIRPEMERILEADRAIRALALSGNLRVQSAEAIGAALSPQQNA